MYLMRSISEHIRARQIGPNHDGQNFMDAQLLTPAQSGTVRARAEEMSANFRKMEESSQQLQERNEELKTQLEQEKARAEKASAL